MRRWNGPEAPGSLWQGGALPKSIMAGGAGGVLGRAKGVRVMESARSERRDWGIVLAAGDGTRLRSLTQDHSGAAVPKQFCSLSGGRTLLGDALARARRVVPAEHVVVVVAAQHREWWERELDHLPRENVIVQPENRGTASGILLPLLSILERERTARVALLPSDHFVSEEHVLARALCQALDEAGDDAVALLGITPDRAETEYGWIVPATRAPVARVATFVEKPGRADAESCLRRGGVWNSFLFASDGAYLLELFARRVPRLLADFVEAFRSEPRAQALAELYAKLKPVDFSRDVLQGSEPSLRLRVVPACGWTDLGTPERVARCLDGLRSRRPVSPRRRCFDAPLDLRLALERSPGRGVREQVALGVQ